MQITVTGSVANAVNRLRSMVDTNSPDSTKKKLEEVARRLCEIGEPIIRQVHGNHASDIHTEPTKSGFKIVAEGEDILFIEFGAGDAAGSENDKYDAVPSEARPGTWSMNHAQMYSRYGFWVFGGHIFREVQPTPAFYYAYEYMVQRLPMIAREVFGQ